jgi:DNA-binding HxlR family transcriptional regulator
MVQSTGTERCLKELEAQKALERKEGTSIPTREASVNLKAKLDGLSGALRSERVRWLVGRKDEIEKSANIPPETFKHLLEKVLREETERCMIISELEKRKEGTVEEISSSTGLSPKLILRHMIALMKIGSVAVTGEKKNEYTFIAQEPP